MAEETTTETKETTDYGKVLASWDFPEYVKFNRGPLWYLITAVILIGLIIFGISTQNYLFILLIALFIIIFVMRSRREPARLNTKITEDGLVVGQKTFYQWKDVNSFWIVYEPPDVKNLYFDFKTTVRPSITIALENQNPIDIRKILLEFVPEDTEKENESFSDGFSRMLKL